MGRKFTHQQDAIAIRIAADLLFGIGCDQAAIFEIDQRMMHQPPLLVAC